MKPLTLIVAMTPSGVIAVDGKIPWHVSEDMKRFKRLTTGHAIIMGRKTYESIGKPLPNRTNIVLTHKGLDSALLDNALLMSIPSGSGITVATSLEDALDVAYKCDESPFVIGGGEIYKLALPLATKLEITYVVPKYAAGRNLSVTMFPTDDEWSYPNLWIFRCTHAEVATESPNVEFVTYERRRIDGTT
jgi:dihydrofolate reductase